MSDIINPFRYNNNDENHIAVPEDVCTMAGYSEYLNCRNKQVLTIHEKVINLILRDFNSLHTVIFELDKGVNNKLLKLINHVNPTTIIFTKAGFLKGENFLFEGSTYIIENFEFFEDKENFIKGLKSKKIHIKNLINKLVETNNEKYITFLFENNIPTYEDCNIFMQYTLNSQNNIYILEKMELYSDKEKQQYEESLIVKEEIDLGFKDYTSKEFKKEFTFTIKDNKIIISKYLLTNDIMIIPGSVDGIHNYSFKPLAKNSTVKKILFEEGVQNIEFIENENPFLKFENIEEIHLPSTIINFNEKILNNKKGYIQPDYVKFSTNVSKSSDDIVILGNEIIKLNNLKISGDIVIPEGIETIHQKAFKNTPNIQSINFPSTIKEIKESAFLECGVQKITFNPLINDLVINESAFSNNFKLNEVELPEKLISIKKNAFNNLPSLKNITIPSTVIEIHPSAFDRINFSLNNNTHFCIKDDILYNDDVTELIKVLPANTQKSYVIPETVKSIGEFAFFKRTDLQCIVLPEGLVSIKEGAFSFCSLLKEIVIPNSVETIGNSAFNFCLKLNTIKMPDNLIELGVGVFAECANLLEISLPNNLVELKRTTFLSCKKLQKVTMGNKIKQICYNCFNGCKSLESINLSTKLETLSFSVFSSCSRLKNITLPNTLLNIGDSAFKSCNSLESIILPDGLKTLGSNVFEKCNSLSTIEIPSTVEEIGTSIFKGITNIKIYTLEKSRGVKWNHTWNSYFNVYWEQSILKENTKPKEIKVTYITEGDFRISEDRTILGDTLVVFNTLDELLEKLPKSITTLKRFSMKCIQRNLVFKVPKHITKMDLCSAKEVGNIEVYDTTSMIASDKSLSESNLYFGYTPDFNITIKNPDDSIKIKLEFDMSKQPGIIKETLEGTDWVLDTAGSFDSLSKVFDKVAPKSSKVCLSATYCKLLTIQDVKANEIIMEYISKNTVDVLERLIKNDDLSSVDILINNNFINKKNITKMIDKAKILNKQDFLTKLIDLSNSL